MPTRKVHVVDVLVIQPEVFEAVLGFEAGADGGEADGATECDRSDFIDECLKRPRSFQQVDDIWIGKPAVFQFKVGDRRRRNR